MYICKKQPLLSALTVNRGIFYAHRLRKDYFRLMPDAGLRFAPVVARRVPLAHSNRRGEYEAKSCLLLDCTGGYYSDPFPLPPSHTLSIPRRIR